MLTSGHLLLYLGFISLYTSKICASSGYNTLSRYGTTTRTGLRSNVTEPTDTKSYLFQNATGTYVSSRASSNPSSGNYNSSSAIAIVRESPRINDSSSTSFAPSTLQFSSPVVSTKLREGSASLSPSKTSSLHDRTNTSTSLAALSPTETTAELGQTLGPGFGAAKPITLSSNSTTGVYYAAPVSAYENLTQSTTAIVTVQATRSDGSHFNLTGAALILVLPNRRGGYVLLHRSTPGGHVPTIGGLGGFVRPPKLGQHCALLIITYCPPGTGGIGTNGETGPVDPQTEPEGSDPELEEEQEDRSSTQLRRSAEQASEITATIPQSSLSKTISGDPSSIPGSSSSSSILFTSSSSVLPSAAPFAMCSIDCEACARDGNGVGDDDDTLKASEFGLIKRVFTEPGNRTDEPDLRRWIDAQKRERGVFFVPHTMRINNVFYGTMSARSFPLTNAAGKLFVSGLYGCTSVIVFSAKRIYMSHIWEPFHTSREQVRDPARVPGEAPTNPRFDELVLDVLSYGNETQNTPGITDFTGPGDDFGPEQRIWSWVVHTGPKLYRNGLIDYAPQIEMIVDELHEIFGDHGGFGEPEVVTYPPTDMDAGPGARLTTVMFNFDPVALSCRQQTCGARLWIDNPARMIWDMTWNPLPEQVVNRRARDNAPACSLPPHSMQVSVSYSAPTKSALNHKSREGGFGIVAPEPKTSQSRSATHTPIDSRTTSSSTSKLPTSSSSQESSTPAIAQVEINSRERSPTNLRSSSKVVGDAPQSTTTAKPGNPAKSTNLRSSSTKSLTSTSTNAPSPPYATGACSVEVEEELGPEWSMPQVMVSATIYDAKGKKLASNDGDGDWGMSVLLESDLLVGYQTMVITPESGLKGSRKRRRVASFNRSTDDRPKAPFEGEDAREQAKWLRKRGGIPVPASRPLFYKGPVEFAIGKDVWDTKTPGRCIVEDWSKAKAKNILGALLFGDVFIPHRSMKCTFAC